MGHVYLESEADVRTLHHLVSQYQSWKVEFALHLTELGCDDWTVLAELLPRLTSVWRVEITTNSTYHPPRDTLLQLWDKTEDWWYVNNDWYTKRDDEAFDKMMNKHFKSNLSLPEIL